MYKVIVYDCDGVLFDSKEAVLAYYDFVCETYSLPKMDHNDPIWVNFAMMKTNEEILNHLTSDKKLIDEIMEFAKKLNFKKFLHLMIPEKNIHESLKFIYENDIKLSVFTNRGSSLYYLLDEFNMSSYFTKTVTVNDVVKPKPHPEGLYKIIQHYNVSKDKILYIGDSTNDYYAAEACGVDFIGYKNKMGDSTTIYDHIEIKNIIQ